jgi:hypothetical protein
MGLLISPDRRKELRGPSQKRGVSRITSVESLMSRFHGLRGQTDDYVPVPVMPFD